MHRPVSKSAVRLFACAAAIVMASQASAQTGGWTSTDVGAVTLAGSATQNGGIWTITGDGSDIWGTADSFQFLHQKPGASGAITTRVTDLQNTSPFAKVGLMVRGGLGADAATVIFDVKPDGGLELMWRESAGAPMRFLAGRQASLPVWLRLEYGIRGTLGIGVEAWMSQDGLHWTELASPGISGTPEVGVAVTSHDSGQLTTAHVDHLTVDSISSDWQSGFVGTAGAFGSASESDGVWTVMGGGADIWGPADGFWFLHRSVERTNQHVRVRVNDLQNTSAFAKAGVMLRTTADPDSPTVILDVKPDGGIEFMARTEFGGDMTFLDGLAGSPGPIWLDLAWHDGGDGTPATATAAVSKDGVSWLPLSGTPPVYLAESFLAGVAVSSHDITRATTAHVQALSVLPLPAVSDDIGSTGLAGNATTDILVCCPALIVEGAGADIWGAADSFEFVHGMTSVFDNNLILSLDAANAFAKAGLMYRDGLDAGAPAVIVDVKPGGGVEFMARPCAGCDMTFIAGAQIGFPAELFLNRNADGTFSASASNGNPATSVNLGTTNVPMSNPISGYAVTSHDTSHTAKAVFVHKVD